MVKVEYIPPQEEGDVLEKYTIDLTQKANQGKLDPVIGRDQEIRRVMEILARRTKNNPVLLGDPGVGKTAIVEGLAQRIASGDVPRTLKGKKILALDMASLLAGSAYRGQFEQRVKKLLKRIEKAEGKYILFMDEVHTLVGAGASRGAVDASNMLKPALARGTLHCIGATTVREYRQYIEKDAALERRFQPVYLSEPSLEETIAILRGVKERYELHHGIRISDDAVIAAATLSERYITDRFLPDKAIDLIDEATSGIKIETESMPYQLDRLKREITQLEIELAALKKEKREKKKSQQKAGRPLAEKVKSQKSKIKSKKEKFQELEKRWGKQKEIIGQIQSLRTKLDKLKLDLEKAQREVELEKAAKIKYGEIPEIKKELNTLEEKWNKIPEEERFLREEVGEEDIARVVARWTGIPVSKLLTSEAEKLAHLEDELRKRVVGQDKAVEEVAGAIRRARTGISEEDRPIGVFLFLGPTGVGKTELAKTLAETLFNDEKLMVRVDMSEYQERHTVARLIGAPPGYVGYEEGGQLTEPVRRKPYSVILLDEIEKAHRDVYNLFLQIFDDGRLTDGQGRVVNFKNTVIIMTSNLGGEIIRKAKKIDKKTKGEIVKLVNHTFPPEFLNRLDQVIIFNRLTPEIILKIVDLQLERVRKRLEEKKIKVKFTKKLKEYLAQEGYDPVFGARPLHRAIQNLILDKLALEMVEGKIKEKDELLVDIEKGEVVIKSS